MKTTIQLALVALLLVATMGGAAMAAGEVCGDGLDNDSDGLADDGCYPTGVTGVCESPLACSRTGAVAPKSGGLVHWMPPDLSPQVPYGPGIAFRRVYQSLYAPTYPSPSNYQTSLGHRWGHNWMSWIYDNGSDIIVHTATGQEVLFTSSGSAGGYDYYTPQPGFHFDYLRQDQSSPYGWELRTLSGTVYEYNWDSDTGTLTAVKDGSGNFVEVTYNGDRKVEFVRDDVNRLDHPDHEKGKYLAFSYSGSGSELLEAVDLYVEDVRVVSVTFTYSSDNLATVEIDSTTVQTYTYTSNYLTKIEDGEGNDIASYNYVYGSPGKVAKLETGNGDIGYEYGGCDSGDGTLLFYNRANTTGCDSDADCGAGLYCGGETTAGTGNTGGCFEVQRCITMHTDNEHLINAVSAEIDRTAPATTYDRGLGVEDYAWEVLDAGVPLPNLTGTMDPTGVWTSYELNSDGLVTKMVEDDTDSDPSTEPAGARITYYTYDQSFPGLVAEIRRHSEIQTGTCNASTVTACKRTIYTYTAAGLVSTKLETGFTYSSGSVSSYSYTTTNTWDGNGRLTKIEGPRSVYDDIEFTYNTATGLGQYYLYEIKYRTNAAARYNTTTLGSYNFWGYPEESEAPDGTVTCRTYDDSMGYLTVTREAMNGQADCSVAQHADDLVTEYTRDSWGRITEIGRPLGNCSHHEYDSEGRISKIKERDDCTPASSGDTIEYTYDTAGDGKLIKIEYKDSSGTVTKRQELGYAADRRVETAKNPEETSYYKEWDYYDDGMAKTLTLEDDLGKTEWFYDDLDREDSRRRYTGSSTYETWDLTPGVQLDLPTEMSDPDSKDIEWVWDDLGRKVKQITPDSGTTLYNYDEAGNLTMRVEAYGDAGEVVHTFSYDYSNRLTEADYGSIDCGGSQGAELQYTYDDASASCPGGADCENQEGRLAAVKAKMWCDSKAGDDTFDQVTYFSYDDAGRVVQEYIDDDATRLLELTYVWDKNGNNTRVVFPNSTQMNTTYGDTANSDRDDIIELARDATDLITEGKWYPFGPIEEYEQANTRNSNNIVAKFTWDLAYRPEEILYEEDTSGSDLFEVDYDLDYAGRTTERDFSSAHASVQDAYYTYDMMSRVTCDSGASGACPSSGSDLKTNMSASPAYTPGGDRKTMIHASPASAYGTYTYTTILTSGTDQIERVSVGRCIADYTYDDRGSRTEDDCMLMTGDGREYTYDGRGNVLTITGEYWTGAAYHDYTLANAYDERNRRIFKSFVDEEETCGFKECEAQWFFYYDVYDRLVMVKHTPDITASSEYTIYEFFWIGQRPVAYFQIDYPGATTTRRFTHSDELNRPVDVWSWPTSGDASRVWAINPDLFGWDYVVTGSSVYQPLRFPGQYIDEETASTFVRKGTFFNARPPLHENRHRYYDPYTGTYLQVDPKVEDTWEAYTYVGQNPVMLVDPAGLRAGSDAPPLWSLCTYGAPWPVFPCDVAVDSEAINIFVMDERCDEFFDIDLSGEYDDFDEEHISDLERCLCTDEDNFFGVQPDVEIGAWWTWNLCKARLSLTGPDSYNETYHLRCTWQKLPRPWAPGWFEEPVPNKPVPTLPPWLPGKLRSTQGLVPWW